METTPVVIRPFAPQDARAFRELNEAWISQLFAIEAKDREVLSDPEGKILAAGGHILMAVVDGQPAGCCALLSVGPGTYEVGKMCVAESARGRGLGRLILRRTVELARQLGARRLYLETSRRLPDAIHLYETAGFRHLPPERIVRSPYARADVYMEMDL